MNEHDDHLNNYTKFNIDPVSPDLRIFLRSLATVRERLPEEVKLLLSQAQTDHQVAKLFFADRGKSSYENVRYWSEKSASHALRALLWLRIGCRPLSERAECYPGRLADTGFTLPASWQVCWTSACETADLAQERIDVAGHLLALARTEFQSRFLSQP